MVGSSLDSETEEFITLLGAAQISGTPSLLKEPENLANLVGIKAVCCCPDVEAMEGSRALPEEPKTVTNLVGVLVVIDWSQTIPEDPEDEVNTVGIQVVGSASNGEAI